MQRRSVVAAPSSAVCTAAASTARIHAPHFWHAAARPQSFSICARIEAAAAGAAAGEAAPFKGEIFRSDPWKNRFPLLGRQLGFIHVYVQYVLVF